MMNEKTAVSKSERDKIIKAVILGSVATAGVGALARSIQSRKERRKANNIERNKNVIVVPVSKSKFMEDLPTPEELAASRGETAEVAKPLLPKPKETLTLPAPAEQKPVSETATVDDIAAKKREILKSRAGKFNFFGTKRASDSKPEKDEDKGNDVKGRDPSDESDKTERDKGDSKKDEGRVLLRDQSGKFVSPTDPVGVAQAEKVASVSDLLPDTSFSDWLSWAGNSVIHPIRTIDEILSAAKDKPVAYTAGAVGSIYLAAKISDAINKRRRKRSEERLEDARNEYVRLIDGGNEKAAESPNNIIGGALGTAFFVPMAITALVTNRIIENRRAEKKREKQMSDSYPDEPIILYKTSEDKEIEMSPESALALLSFKRSIMQKTAEGPLSENEVNSMRDDLMDVLTNADYDDGLFDIVNGRISGDDKAVQRGFGSLKAPLSSSHPMTALRLNAIKSNPAAMAQLRDAIMSSKRMGDHLANRISSGDEKSNWGKFRAARVNENLEKTWGIKEGGILHSIISWIMRFTGMDKSLAGRYARDYFSKAMNGGSGGSATQGSDTGAQQTQSAPTDPTQGTRLDPTRIGGLYNFNGENVGGGDHGGMTPASTPPAGPYATPPVPATGDPGTTNSGAEKVKNPLDHFKWMNPAYGWERIAKDPYNTESH